MPHATRLLAAMGAAVLFAGPVDAAPLYTINFYHLGQSNNSVSSATPFQRDTAHFVLGTAGVNGSFTGGSAVGVAEVRVASAIDAVFPGLNGSMQGAVIARVKVAS